jgi:anti-anti-sigma factor
MPETTVDEKDGIIILNLYGQIALQNIHKIEKLWNEQIDKGPDILALNFTGIDRIDSIGLSHLVKLSRNAIVMEIELIFYNMNQTNLDLFKVAKLDQFFNILTEQQFKEKYLEL